ncbi:MAG: alpha-amylase family glycosyl hydrolase, partial [Polyangiaceae bacterium]
MQAKTEHSGRHLAPKRQIALEVSWDSADFGDDVPEVVGEWADWEEGTAIAVASPSPPSKGTHGRGVATLDLEEGVYAYKLKTSRCYALNTIEPRTVTVDGVTNNVLSVGGAREPILHAPAAPFLHYPESGGVLVRAALRKDEAAKAGATSEGAQSLWIVWREGYDTRERETELAACGETDSHCYFETRLPVSADRFEYVFRTGDGARIAREDGVSFAARGRDVPEVPAWWRDAVLYTIFVDRFRPSTDRDDWDTTDPSAGKWAGGDLEGIRRSLDELSELGINTLYLTPIHVAASCHRYDLEDPSRVDPALGGEKALEALLHDVHARGMRLILDWSFSHSSTQFGPYRDVLAEGEGSAYADWFQWTKRDADGAPRVRHYAGCTSAPLLDLNQRELATYALATAEHWIRRGVDGLRIDCAAQVPFDLLVELRRRVRALNADAVVVGELVPGHAWRWREAGALDASTDFAFYRLAVGRFGAPCGERVDLGSRWEKLALARGNEPVHH